MTLSIVSVEGTSDRVLKKRMKDFFSEKNRSLKKKSVIFLREDICMTIILSKRGIVFSTYKNTSGQKKFVHECIGAVFKGNIVAVECEDNCDWIKDVKNIEIYKI